MRARRRRLRSVLSYALLLVQAVIVLTAVVEGYAGVGMASHVEAQGSGHHYSHTEANCAYCAASSIHATAAQPPATPFVRAVHGEMLVARAIHTRSAERVTPHHSRPPPAVA